MPRKPRAEGTRAPNGAATVYVAKDGRWHGRVTMGALDNGKPDRRHVSAKTEAEVLTKVRALEKDRDAGRTRRPGRAWTLEKWLHHWLENIAAGRVRPKTYSSYNTAVNRLTLGLGAHRTDRLQPEQIERFYTGLLMKGLAPATVHHTHRTLSASLNEAVKRGQISRNPARIAKAPQLLEDEIEPFTMAEAKRILAATVGQRNGVRFAIALAIGLRQGEALGLKWSDFDGDAGTLTIRRALQRQVWRHGCDSTCGKARGADCPKRHAGGLVVVPTKSRAGRRVVGLPAPLVTAIQEHREEQSADREHAANLWIDGDWIFAQRTGKALDPRADYEAWRDLLKAAGVRPARLHDARHTAATMLLVLKVPTRAVLEVMGWSHSSMTNRYQHVPAEVLSGIADQVGGLLWSAPNSVPDGTTETGTETTRSD